MGRRSNLGWMSLARVVLACAGTLLWSTGQAGTLGTPAISPGTVVAGAQTTVKITVGITDPNYIQGSANVQRLKADGTVQSVMGVLRDDGQQGDAVAGDQIHTLDMPLQEPSAGNVRFQVSAAYQRELKRTLSAPITLVVDAAAAPTVSAAQLNPGSVQTGQGVVALASAFIDHASAPDTVVLQRLDGNGAVQATVGALRDDGAEGDASAGDKTWSLRMALLENTPGTTTYRVAATFPGYGQAVHSAPFTLTVTGTATGVVITTPANGSYLNTPVVTVAGTVGDPAATVTLNGIATPLSGKSFAASVPLNEGPNTVTAVVANSNGTTSTGSVHIHLDTTAPKVEIYSPAAGGNTTADKVSVSGMVNDIVVGTVNEQQATVTVNGVVAEVLNRSFVARDVPLSVGGNTLQAIATDRAGNRATTVAQLTRQAASPGGLRIVSGNNQAARVGTTLAAPLVVALTSAQGAPLAGKPVVFRVIGLDGTVSATTTAGSGTSAVAVNTDQEGKARVHYTLGSRAGAGNNLVEASAAGVAATADFVASASPGGAKLMVVDSGNHQFGVVGQALPWPFIAIVTDSSNNRLANVPVTFTVKQGGGGFGADRSPTLNTVSDSDGRVAAALILGPEQGMNQNVVEASFSGNDGFPAIFAATGLVPGPASQTRISGVVLDNSNNPIPGVTMRLLHITQGNRSNIPQEMATAVRTDAQGQFVMQPVPVGVFKLMADGDTAQRPGTWPTLDFDMITVSGQNNTLGMPVFLPEINPNNRLCVNESTGGTLTLAEVPGFALTIAPGSATFPGGSRNGCVSVTPVNIDKVPMAPGFGQQPRFVVTIQPAGTHFSPAARMTIPNVDGLAPRAVTEMYSYDHDLAAFVAIGSATVSEDGATITSDLGAGVIKAGWHCGGNPNTSGSAGTCPTCKKCQGSNCVADNGQTPPQASTTDCKEQFCNNGSVGTRNKDSEQPEQKCKECKNGGPANRADGSTPADQNICCFQGQELPKFDNPFNVVTNRCPQRTQVPDSHRQHDIDGCSGGLTDNIQDPMRGKFGNDWAGQASTEFGRPQGAVPNAGAALPLPCNLHDICYQTCRSDKGACDTAMRDRIRGVCAVAYPATCPAHLTAAQCQADNGFMEQRGECAIDAFSYANLYYQGVNFGGTSAYEQRQSQYCQCCP